MKPRLRVTGFVKSILADDSDVVFTHWAPCPTNGEPIMLLIRDVP